MDRVVRAASLLPEDYRQAFLARHVPEAEELRLRRGRAPSYLCAGREIRFSERLCREEDLLCVLEKASGASLHAVEDTLCQGYVTSCGVRIGVCGTRLPGGESVGYRSFSSLCLRIPRECRGIARELLPALRENAGAGTLILSPPGGGKTTLLRECIRCLSNGGLRVAVVDERGELCAAEDGGGFDLGCCSDVLTGAPKASGSMQLLRCMNPQLIAMDEITRREDMEAVREIAGCGVGLLATVHASSPEQMQRRPLYRELLEGGIFTLALVICGAGRARQYSLMRIAS